MHDPWVCDSDYWGLEERLRKKQGGRLIRLHLITLLITPSSPLLHKQHESNQFAELLFIECKPHRFSLPNFQVPWTSFEREGKNSGHAAFLKIKFHVAIYQKTIQKDTLK